MRQKADKKHHELNKLSYCYVGMYINRYNANMIPPYQGDASDTLLTSFFSFLPRFEIDLWKHFAKVRYNFYLRKVSFTMVVWTVKLFFSVLRLFNYLLTLISITLKDFHLSLVFLTVSVEAWKVTIPRLKRKENVPQKGEIKA